MFGRSTVSGIFDSLYFKPCKHDIKNNILADIRYKILNEKRFKKC